MTSATNKPRKTLLVFLGNSVQGILADAAEEFGDEVDGVLVIAANNDRLTPPEGVPSVEVRNFTPVVGEEYILVANGGRSVQLVPTLAKLWRRKYPSPPSICSATANKSCGASPASISSVVVGRAATRLRSAPTNAP